ncbi:MAG: VIT domain-containing protein [Nitrospirota bacterium]
MKPVRTLSAVLALAAIILIGTTGTAQQKESDDKTLSPYFFVKSDSPDVDQLPLKATSAAVNISGVIADVKVTQVYKNEGKHALEAIYIFPASTRAAVYAMKMTIGERVINAKIKKRDEARQEYEQAKQQGKSASLLEQQRPNVFQMNVANIMPGDEIKVEMSYTELLVPTDKVYEFAYPTVVGPRYSNQPAQAAPASEKWVQNPYLHQGEAPHYTFDITANIATGMPIQKLFCTSHKVNVNYHGSSSASIMLDKSEQSGGNRDYILKYRLAGDQVESGLLLYPGERENFFLLMLQPPKRVTTAQIPGREYIFIVDVSGSMYGFPLEISKKLLKDLLGNLRSTDKFNVLLFAGGSTLMSEESLPATTENINRAINVIDREHGGGGTELLPALKRALALPRNKNYSRTVVIATDGYVTLEEEAFDLIRNSLGSANMFAFGIGTSVNRHIIEGMAHVGMGEPFIITKPEEAPAKAEAFRKLIQSPVLTQVKVNFGGFDAYDVEPMSIPDVLADRPVIIFGKWRGKAQGKIALHGISSEEPYADVIEVNKVKPLTSNSALRYLWARHRIQVLSDYNMLRPDDERVKEVTNLGLTYNLLTAYTSFVAIDSEVRNKDGKTTTVNQPLPLPEGVSDYAVGGMMAKSAAPSPMMLRENFSVKDKRETAFDYAEGAAAPEKKASSMLKIGELVVSRGLSREAVRATVQQHIKELQGCLQGIALQGKLTVKFVLNADGTVKSVTVVSTQLTNKSAEQCLVGKMRNWLFPAGGAGGITATVSFIVGS